VFGAVHDVCKLFVRSNTSPNCVVLASCQLPAATLLVTVPSHVLHVCCNQVEELQQVPSSGP
jgi:hypothetical protein